MVVKDTLSYTQYTTSMLYQADSLISVVTIMDQI